MKISVQLFMLLLLTFAMPIQAVEITREVKTRYGFTMHLPENWIEIPNRVLKQSSENANKLVPQIMKQVYDYGFQLAPVNNWCDYPYILIQVKNIRHSSKLKLTIKKINSLIAGNRIEEDEGNLPNFISNLQHDEIVNDTDNHIIWRKSSCDEQQIGRVNIQEAYIITRFGTIDVMGYATEETFSSYQTLFQEIARQIILDDSIKY